MIKNNSFVENEAPVIGAALRAEELADAARTQDTAALLDGFNPAPPHTLGNRAQPVALLCRPRSAVGDVERR